MLAKCGRPSDCAIPLLWCHQYMKMNGAWTRHRKLRNQTSSMTFAIPGNKRNVPIYPMVKTPSKLALTKCHCVFHLGTEQVMSHYLNHWWRGSQTCVEIDGCPVENDNGCKDRRWNTPCQHYGIHVCRLANSMLQTLRCYTRKSIKQYFSGLCDKTLQDVLRFRRFRECSSWNG